MFSVDNLVSFGSKLVPYVDTAQNYYTKATFHVEKAKSCYAELKALQTADKKLIFWEGFKNQSISQMAKTTSYVGGSALTALVAGGGSVYACISGSRILGGTLATAHGTSLVAMVYFGKKVVVDTMVEGYYLRVSQIVDKHLGEVLGVHEKEVLKRKIVEMIGNQHVEQINDYILNHLKMKGEEFVNDKIKSALTNGIK